MALHNALTGSELHIAKTNVNAGDPNGSVTAAVIGELCWDSTNNIFYVAEAADNSSWIATFLTPWVADIDADGFDLKDLSNVEFRSTTGAPAGTVQNIHADAGGINYNVPTSDIHDFWVNDISQLTISVSTIDFKSNTLTDIADITSITNLNGVAIGNYAISTDNLSVFAATTSAELAGVISNETGMGLLVFNDTPTFITPVLGTPGSGLLTSCTGYPGDSFLTTTGPLVTGASIAVTNNGATAGFISLEEPNGDSTATITVPALAANYTLTLPIDAGSSGQRLQTDGNGILTWVTP